MTRGLYIAGSGKDAGKTTLCLGLAGLLGDMVPGGISFYKPMGRKVTEVDGDSVGQDSLFLPFDDSIAKPSLTTIIREIGAFPLFDAPLFPGSPGTGFITAFDSTEQVLSRMERSPGKGVVAFLKRLFGRG